MITSIFATNNVKSFGNFDGSLPWLSNKTDMIHFVSVTKSIGTVVMGRGTYESLLTETKRMKAVDKNFVEPLAGRRAIVLTTKLPNGQDLDYAELYKFNDSLYFFNRSTITACQVLERQFGDICIIGGSGIIRDTINITNRVYYTCLDNDAEGDIILDVGIPHNLDYFSVFPDKSGTVYCYTSEETYDGY